MRYDTTGPVTIKEWKSLLVLLAIVGLVAGGWWLVTRNHKADAAATQTVTVPPLSSERPRGPGKRRPPFSRGSRPVDTSPAGNAVVRIPDDPSLVLVKARGVWVSISPGIAGKSRT